MMLSRIADSLYWLDRYMERTDGVLRILRTEYVLSLDTGNNIPTSWRPVLKTFAHADEELLGALEYDTAKTLHFLIADTDNTNSLRALLNRARENARGAQDHITKEVWEQVNHVYHTVNNPMIEEKLKGQDALALLDSMTEMVTLYKGVTGSTMPRSMGWNFMNLGKYMERTIITLEVTNRYFGEIKYNLADNKDILYWRQLLLSLSGYELHLKTYRNTQYTQNVADQIFFNRQFTRSIRYSLDKIGHYLDDVIAMNNPAEKELLIREFGRLRSKIQYADLAQVNAVTPEKFIADIRLNLLQFNRLLTQVFFSYA
jgi:uncharacterized alpha-E superfamily protein